MATGATPPLDFQYGANAHPIVVTLHTLAGPRPTVVGGISKLEHVAGVMAGHIAGGLLGRHGDEGCSAVRAGIAKTSVDLAELVLAECRRREQTAEHRG